MTGTILIVEDDLLVAEQVQAAVLSMGYAAPTIARSGTEALLAITETQPALVLIDIRLKGEMSGIQVAAFLREHHGIPVVYVSSLVDDETLRRARDTAPHRYVVKPFTADDIRAAVEVALYRAQLDAALLDMSGFLGVVGTDGALDLVAQGGGGGGGAKGGTGANQCPNQAGTKGGASGGSGGAGGRGGTPGGASIALVSLNATFAFADVTLTAGNGGNGGQGGDGQQGGSPGAVGSAARITIPRGSSSGSMSTRFCGNARTAGARSMTSPVLSSVNKMANGRNPRLISSTMSSRS